MEDPMGFERNTIPSTETLRKAKREAEPVVTPLRSADASGNTCTLRLARQMRSEWRKERYSRLAGR
jgi:hypothetical protein